MWTLLVFKARRFEGSSLHWGSQGLRWLMWGMNPLLLRFVRSFLLAGYHTRGGVFGKTVSLPLLPSLTWPFYYLLWGSCSASFQVFFREGCSVYSCRFCVFMGRGDFRFFLHCPLGPRPWPHFKLLQIFIYHWKGFTREQKSYIILSELCCWVCLFF